MGKTGTPVVMVRRCRIWSRSRWREGGEVGFVEENNGTCTALLGEDEKALDAALIEVAIEAADDEENVDVGGEYLLLH
jgi:hypothetical protein